MVIAIALYTSLLLAGACVARPATALDRSVQQRARPGPLSSSVDRKAISAAAPPVITGTGWTGVAQSSKPGTYKAVSGTFVLPPPKVPSGGDSSGFYTSAAWVGIDGFNCESAILQAGLDMTIQDGKTSYHAWYQWWPANSVYWDNIAFSAGDKVSISIQANSTTSGSATIKNLTKKTKVSQFIKADPSTPICMQEAEWIVENFDSGSGSTGSLANFGKVVFTGAEATKVDGSCVGPSGGQEFDLEDPSTGDALSKVSSTNNSVTISYV